MKRIFVTIKILICFFIVVINHQSACANGPTETITISGNVYGKDNKKLHSIDIVVYYKDDKEKPKLFHTESDGSYKIKLRKISGDSATIIDLQYSSTGYMEACVKGLNGAENQVINKMMYLEGDYSYESLSDAQNAIALILRHAKKNNEPKEKIQQLYAKLYEYSYLIMDKDTYTEEISMLLTKNKIMRMQKYLALEGFYKGKVDGIIGVKTFDAIAKWSKREIIGFDEYAIDAEGLMKLEAKSYPYKVFIKGDSKDKYLYEPKR